MATHMQVVLQEDVSNLGNTGEVVRVRPGYARNFLLPRGLAVPATAGNLARVEEIKKAAASRAAKELTAAKEQAAKLGSVSVRITRKVGAEGRMYGSVTTRDIEAALAAQGVTVERRRIELGDAIKAVGSHSVTVKLHPQVVATLSVEVAAGG